DPFFAIEADRVLKGEDDDHEPHPNEAYGATDVEQTIAATEKVDFRLPEQSEVPNCEQDAQFGWSEAPERDAELSQRVRRKIRLDGEHQEPDEQANGDSGMHVSRKSQADHQRKGSEAVDHVVDIKAVTGTLALANGGKGAVERISEPVEGEAGDDAEQGVAVPS